MAEIRRAGPSDIDACESVLAMAFRDDPGMIHIEPDIARRADLLAAFFRTFLSASLAENGDLGVAGDPLDGMAGWFGPEQHGRRRTRWAQTGSATFWRLPGAGPPIACSRWST